MFGLDFACAHAVGFVDGEDHGVPEFGRAEGFGEFGLVGPFEIAVARVDEIVVVVFGCAEQTERFFAEAVDVDVHSAEDFGRDVLAIGEHADDEVFGSHIAVVVIAGFLDGVGDGVFEGLGVGAAGDGGACFAGFELGGDLVANVIDVDVEQAERFCGDALAFGDEAEHEVGGREEVVPHFARLVIGECHRVTRPI